MFKEINVDFCFTCLEMNCQDKHSNSAPEKLVQEVFEIANKHGVKFEGENAIECYHWHAYNQILKWASKGLKESTFLRMTNKLMNDEKTLTDFKKFTEQMHRSSSSNEKENKNKKENVKENNNENYEYHYEDNFFMN